MPCKRPIRISPDHHGHTHRRCNVGSSAIHRSIWLIGLEHDSLIRSSIRTDGRTYVAMSRAKRTHASDSGYAPQHKKSKMMAVQADKADSYLLKKQPGRLHLGCMKWHSIHRGHSGIMPMHVHVVAHEIVTMGTSLRRYGSVKLVEVPEGVVENWLKLIKHKTSLNTLLPTMVRFSPTGPYYANLDHSFLRRPTTHC